MFCRRLLYVYLLTVVSLVGVTFGQSYFAVSGSDFLTETNFIFKGTAVQKSYFRNRADDSIMTRYVFQVDEIVKGEPREWIEVVEYGGRLDGLIYRLSHTPEYVVGQSYFVFTYSDLQANTRTFAQILGQIPVIRNQAGQESVLIPAQHPLLTVLPAPFAKNLQSSAELRTGLSQAVGKVQQWKNESDGYRSSPCLPVQQVYSPTFTSF